MTTFNIKCTLKFVLFLSFCTICFSDYSQIRTPVTFGKFLITPIEIATIRTKQRSKTISEPVNIFLIQTEGKNILIDAGIDSSWNNYKKSHLKTRLFFKNFSVSNRVNINDVLKELGLSTDSIQFLILTHSHFDHIYGLSTFKNAKIILSKKEGLAFKWGLLNGYLRINIKSIKAASRITPGADSTLNNFFLKSYTLIPNFKIIPAYGHTKGHIAVILESDDTIVLFTGDSTVDVKRKSTPLDHLIQYYKPIVFRNHSIID